MSNSPHVERIEVCPADVEAIAAASSALPSLSSLTEATFFNHVESVAPEISNKLHPDLVSALSRLALHEGPEALIFEFPSSTTEGIGSTPDYYIQPDQPNLFSSDYYSGFLAAVAGLHAYGSAVRQAGLIHSNVIFTKRGYQEGAVSAGNAAVPWHTEGHRSRINEDYDLMPDFLVLHFLRNNENLGTALTVPDLTELSPATVEKLWQPTLNLAFGDTVRRVPVLYGDAKKPYIQYTMQKLLGPSQPPDTKAALSELENHLESRRIAIPVKAGDVVFIDNRRALHGRGRNIRSTVGSENGRWQRRTFYARDPNRLQPYLVKPRIVMVSAMIEKYLESHTPLTS